ncbi:MAG: hypothetical protein SF187_17060 [Deltaproteobacteria bacterium]|nr:hypothetical protein [Deltaproteobacteria bacterium]
MNNQETRLTTYVPGEGRNFMETCIRAAFEACRNNELTTIVMFTATGEGPLFALREMLNEPELQHIKVIAVTPPFGQAYLSDPSDRNSPRVIAGVPSVAAKLMTDSGIPIVAAHLPFKGPPGEPGEHGPESQWALVDKSFSILGGGFALCVQATLLACDAGHVRAGERIVALTSDTAMVVTASRTELWLSQTHGLLFEYFVCRPSVYNISKARHLSVREKRMESLMHSPLQLTQAPMLEEESDDEGDEPS